MKENYSDVSDYQKISKMKIEEGITAAEVARRVGDVRIADPEKPGMTKIVKPGHVKKEILGLAKSGESINHFKKETLVNELDIQGSNESVKDRKSLIEVIKSLFSKKPSAFQIKEDKIRREAEINAALAQAAEAVEKSNKN